MRFALLQLNLTVGDAESNASKIAAAAHRAGQEGAELCVSTELALSGYPPRDLLLSSGFVRRVREALDRLAERTADAPPLLVGFPEANETGVGKPLHNSAALLMNGRVERIFRKTLLPSYDVFDEDRYFEPGPGIGLVEMQGKRIAVTVCEDIWNDTKFWEKPLYTHDPLDGLDGVDVIVNLSASPFSLGKQRIRQEMITAIAKRHRAHVLYVNQVGGNDDLLFAGRTLACAPDGTAYARGRPFAQDILHVDADAASGTMHDDDFSPESETWRALVMGARDYVYKCGFSKVLLGLSGGVDSSLTAAVAVEALGAGNVLGVIMPSPYTRQESIEDAHELAANLGMETLTIPIAGLMMSYDDALAEAFAGFDRDVTEENIQARIRGNLLMALSNKYGSMLLATGNKSELAVGYCTIYGDLTGGLAVISDVPKTLVYRVCNWVNDAYASMGGEIIPYRVIEKPPSAELRPDQKDQDLLPPYETLDAILERMIRRHESVDEIAEAGFERETVAKIARMVRNAEFKRLQAPPGLKITDVSFGTGWRMPIAARIKL
jgi:NAD+ synthetase